MPDLGVELGVRGVGFGRIVGDCCGDTIAARQVHVGLAVGAGQSIGGGVC